MKSIFTEKKGSIIFRQLCITAIATCLFKSPLWSESAKAPSGKPNVLFILVDDLGWSEVGYQNPRIKVTPNVDRLAEEGIVFSSAYAATVCSPARAEILTGRSPATLKLTSHIPGVGFEQYLDSKKKMLSNKKNHYYDAEMSGHLALDEVTLAEAFKVNGYTTGFFGKWHLGGDGSVKTKDGVVNQAWHPQYQGFDVNIGGCAYGQPARRNPYFSPYANAELPDGEPGEYLTDRLVEETIAFMEESKDEPFFAYLSLYTIHSPFRPKPSVSSQGYKGKMGMIVCMDEAVGLVLQAVDDMGLRENTIVVFTSDNGGTGRQDLLRGSKGSIYEGGVRVPLIYRLPGETSKGKTVDSPVAAADFFPTLMDLTGSTPPAEAKRLDGISYHPLLVDSGEYQERPVYQHFPHHRVGNTFQGASTVRDGDWKLIWDHHEDEYRLFNLKEDRGESKNLSALYPEKVSELEMQLKGWLERVDANMPRQL